MSLSIANVPEPTPADRKLADDLRQLFIGHRPDGTEIVGHVYPDEDAAVLVAAHVHRSRQALSRACQRADQPEHVNQNHE